MPPTYANGKICYVEIPAIDIPRSVAFYQADPVANRKSNRRGSTLLFVLAVIAAGSGVANAATPGERWRDELAHSSDLIRSGHYATALRIVDRVIDEMIDGLGPGKAETQFFMIVLVHKAAAYVGLGKESDALWYWNQAIGLNPRVIDSDMTIFGVLGQFLKQHPLPRWSLNRRLRRLTLPSRPRNHSIGRRPNSLAGHRFSDPRGSLS